MEAALICKQEQQNMLVKLLYQQNVFIVETSPILIVDRQLYEDRLWEKYALLIQFDSNNLHYLVELLQKEVEDTPKNFILGKGDEEIVPISYTDIIYIYGCHNETFVYNRQGKEYRIRYKLYQLEEAMLSDDFIRINKSEIVNIMEIESIAPLFKGNLMLKMKHMDNQLSVSRGYLKIFKERLGM